MGESRISSRTRVFAPLALAAMLTVLAITSVGVQSAAANEADARGAAHNPWTVQATPIPARKAGSSPAPRLLAAEPAAAATPFPIGYVVGGVLVVLGVAGGIYGQVLRRRGRRPPGS
ncbi:MAG TPA: hypothetical protein DCP11_01355 [Microbacteriaceae bacterium]|jgi:hypothetical protein|nr:hypothetical protein [Microbacteriaceae bacterium]